MTDPKARARELAEQAWDAMPGVAHSQFVEAVSDAILTGMREMLAREPTEAMVKAGTPVIYEMVNEDKPSPLIAYRTWKAQAAELAKELG